MKEIKIDFSKINKKSLIILIILLVVASFAVWTRLGTMKSQTILDYDPWYHFRLAKLILENNLKKPFWDSQTFAPPGREFEPYVGWEYTMIIFYKVLQAFKSSITFLQTAKLAPVIMVGLSAISAFLLGKELTNSVGGLFTSLFATCTATFISVSMAGYSDTDVVVVFFSFLTIFSVFLAVNKKKWYYYAFSVISILIFIFSWFFGWYVPAFFTAFIVALLAFRSFEYFIKHKKLDFKKVFDDSKDIIKPLLIIIIATNLIAPFLGLSTEIRFFLAGLGFTGAEDSLLVNVSVAELQPINILTKSGFLQVANRVGTGPAILFLLGLPLLVIYKLFKKIPIAYSEIFMFMWAAITFWLILHGVRFTLLFSCAVATAAGYVIGNLVDILKKNALTYTIFGVIGVMTLMFVSDAMAIANQASGMQVSQNWISMLDWLKENADENAIVATWWDPGHIIAGYTGLKVHADGAHCNDVCVPYDHDVRIQDMGRIMSTSDEDEAMALLEKYMDIDDDICQWHIDKYGEDFPVENCEPLSEMYFISSNDLIGKFTWMNYFGGFRAPIQDQQSFIENPGVCCAATPKSEPGQISCGEFADQGRGVWVWCPWFFSLEKTATDENQNPVYIYDYSGLKLSIIQRPDRLIPVYSNNYVINNMVYYDGDTEVVIDNSDLDTSMPKIDGLVWVDPSFTTILYFSPEIKDSIFVKTFFFDGEGLTHFEQVFKNSEIRLYRVNFD